MQFTFQAIKGLDAYPSKLAFVLYGLDQQHFPTPWTLDSWNNLFVGHDRLLTLMVLNEEVIALCLFDKQIADSFGHLLKIIVRPDYQSKGLSRPLLKYSLSILEKEGVTDTFLEVDESNLSAQKLYLGEKFNVIHRKKDFYGQGRAALIMVRKIVG